jgi:hypothetical protein
MWGDSLKLGLEPTSQHGHFSLGFRYVFFALKQTYILETLRLVNPQLKKFNPVQSSANEASLIHTLPCSAFVYLCSIGIAFIHSTAI